MGTTSPGEAIVRQAIVLRLLAAAGFDIWNPTEVVPEETNAAGKRADFMVQTEGATFALELKGMGVGLKPVDYQQAANYAANQKTRWAILTNGKRWVVLDRLHNPGGSFRDHEILTLSSDVDGFADDLALLLDRGAWSANMIAERISSILAAQAQRRENALIVREKLPLVKQFQLENEMGSFEKAVKLYAQLGHITGAESEVLLRVSAAVPAPATRAAPPLTSAKKPVPGGPLHFTYAIRGAKARAVFDPAQGTWTVLAGSTALGETNAYAQAVRLRREQGLADGRLTRLPDGTIQYVKDVVYTSPSSAADDISGASKNGWDEWKDERGRSAQHHRPVRD